MVKSASQDTLDSKRGNRESAMTHNRSFHELERIDELQGIENNFRAVTNPDDPIPASH